MKIRINAEETYTTTISRESIDIDTDNYPELEGMTENQISFYIDDHIWDMKATNPDLYNSLGEEVMDKAVEYDNIDSDDTTFYTSEVFE